MSLRGTGWFRRVASGRRGGHRQIGRMAGDQRSDQIGICQTTATDLGFQCPQGRAKPGPVAGCAEGPQQKLPQKPQNRQQPQACRTMPGWFGPTGIPHFRGWAQSGGKGVTATLRPELRLIPLGEGHPPPPDTRGAGTGRKATIDAAIPAVVPLSEPLGHRGKPGLRDEGQGLLYLRICEPLPRRHKSRQEGEAGPTAPTLAAKQGEIESLAEPKTQDGQQTAAQRAGTGAKSR